MPDTLHIDLAHRYEATACGVDLLVRQGASNMALPAYQAASLRNADLSGRISQLVTAVESAINCINHSFVRLIRYVI